MKLRKFYSFMLLFAALMCGTNVWGEELTVADGTVTNAELPVYGWYADTGFKNQFIYSADDLAEISGASISKLSFYSQNSTLGVGTTAKIAVRIAEISNSTFTSASYYTPTFTDVYLGNFNTLVTSGSDYLLTLDFTTPYEYNGGNLLIEVQLSPKGSLSPSSSFYGISSSGNGLSGYGSSYANKYIRNFLPKVTFTYEGAETGSCAKPKSLAVSAILPDGATFTWAQGAEETAYQYACVAKGATPESWTDVEGTERTLTLHGLTAGTSYDLYVRSNCGEEQSTGAKVNFTPICPAPTAPVVSDITTTSATLSWTGASGITDYQYIVVERDAAENWASPTMVEGSTTASLTTTAGTKYDVYVRSYFNETTVSASVKVQFATPCVAMSAINDFNGTFESETAGSGLMPNCWEAAATYEYSDYYSSATYPCIKSNEYSGANTGSHWIAFHGGKDATKNIALLPVFTEALNTLTISFYYKSGSTYYGGYFSLGYYKDGVFTAYTSASNLERKNSYTKFEFAIPTVADAEGARLAIQYAGGSYDYEASIDDITFELTPSCTKPSNVTVSNIVYDGATIDWTENGSAESWKIQYSTDNTNWTTANGGENITTHPYDLRGLTTGTPYYVQVQSVCGGTDGESPFVASASTFTPAYKAPTGLTVGSATTTAAIISWTANSGESSWTVQYKKSGDADWTTVENVTANPYTITGLTSGSSYQVKVAAGTLYTTAVNFNTECEAKSIPFSEDFNDAETNKLPSCWSAAGNTTAVYVVASSTYLTLSSNALYFTGGSGTQAIAILPDIDADLNTLQVAFSHIEESTTKSGQIKFGYYKEGVFTELKTCDYSESSSVWKDEAAFPITGIPTGGKLAFSYTPINSAYTAAVDNISITEYIAPSCAAPTALTASDIATNSASISWTSEASEFALEYKKTSDEDWTAATGTIVSPFALKDLMANETEYTVRVKAICGESNESEWVELAAPFKTNCTIKTVTEETAWTENFETLTADQVPACWYLPTANDSYYYAKVIASEAKESTQCLDIRTYGTSSEIIVLPEFNEPVEHLNISFDYKNVNIGSRYGYLEVGYYSESTFTRVGEALSKVENYTASGVIEMPKTDVPVGARLAFRLVGVYNSYNSHAYIDNLTVIRKPACAVPTALAAVATSTGATLTWTAGDEETQWNVRYSIKDADSWAVLENKTSGFALTGLEVGTTYEVQVQAYCDETHQSAWTASAIFTPVCGAAPTALAVSARTTNSATLTWEGTESAFKLQTSIDGEAWEDAVDVNDKTYDLTSLTAGTTYYVRVQNACGGEYASTSFTTWCGLQDATELPLNIESFTAVPECWEVMFANASSQITNGKIFFYGEEEQWAILPAYDIELNKLSVTFGFSISYADLTFGYIDEPNGEFHAFASQPTTGVELNLENEDAAVKYIAIRYAGTSTYASGSISSVQLRKTPTCAKPTDLVVTPNVGTAMINWNSEATAWNLQYKLASAAEWTDAEVTAKPFELTGLAQGASYKVRVQAKCGEELSDWSDEMLFTTSCEAITTIPFVERFDTELSSCWNITDDETNYYAHSVYDGTLRLPGGKAASGHLVVLPEISASLEKAVMTIEYTATTGANTATPQVGYMDGESFVELAPLSKSGSTTEARIELATANGHRLALRYDDGISEGDFNITEIRVINQAVLEDSENNEAALGELIGETVDITINRTLTEGYFNTLCLPFDLATLESTPLAGSELWGFKYGNVENGELLIRIIEQDELQAGVPYLIKVPATVTNPTFKGVTIQEKAGKSVGQTEEVQFIGILKPEAFTTSGDDVHKKLFLLPNDQLAWAGKENNLKSFRAYFRTTENISGTPVAGMPARIVKEKNEATGCETVQGEHRQSLKVLENNQVVIIRNGVRYNLQGQKIQ